jgi:hypothetical protein
MLDRGGVGLDGLRRRDRVRGVVGAVVEVGADGLEDARQVRNSSRAKMSRTACASIGCTARSAGPTPSSTSRSRAFRVRLPHVVEVIAQVAPRHR